MKFYCKTSFLFYFIFLNTFVYGQAPEFEWAFNLGGSSNDQGYDVTVDSWGSEDIYVTGVLRNTVDFDPGPGTHTITSSTEDKIYLAKYTADKEFQWVATFPKGFDRLGYKVQTDSSGNVYMAGHFYGSGDFDPGPGTVNLTATGHDVYVVKLTTDGDFLWVKRIGASVANAMVVDASGNSYTVGTFYGTIDFDPGSGVYNKTSNGYDDVFVLKLDSNGDFVWAKTFGGVEYERVNAVAIDQSNNVYLSGTFTGAVDFDPDAGIFNLFSSLDSYRNVYISKLNSDGEFIWAKSINSSNSTSVGDLVINLDGDIIITGSFTGITDLDPGNGEHIDTSVWQRDFYLLKLDTDGDLIWAKVLGAQREQIGIDLAIDKNNAIYATGRYDGPLDFDPGPNTYILSTSSNSISDFFTLKLDSDGSFVWARSFVGTDQYYNAASGISVDNDLNVYTMGRFFGAVDFDPNPTAFSLSPNGYDDAFVHKMSQPPCNVEPVISSSNLTYVNCPYDSIDLSVSVPSWLTDVSYNWSTGASSNTIFVSPDTATVYSVLVSYTSENMSCIDSASIEVSVILNAVEIPYNNFDDDCDPGTLDDDLDQDGYILIYDCDDNDPSVPAVPGTTCNDGYYFTTNDIILSDSCTCKGNLINGPEFEWVVQPLGSHDKSGSDIATDVMGNIYVVGVFKDTVDFDPGPEVYNLFSAENSWSIFATKYSPTGQLEWAFSLGNNYSSSIPDIAVDDVMGQVYITGSFKGTIDFDPGSEVYELTQTGSTRDLFLLKLDLDGNFNWVRQKSSWKSVFAGDIAVDFNGDFIYITGAMVDEDEDEEDYDSAYVLKYSKEGEQIWLEYPGGSNGASIALDSFEHIYLTGRDKKKIRVAKLTTDGDNIWSNVIGGSTTSTHISANYLRVDKNGNVFITGNYKWTIDFDPGPLSFALTSMGQEDIFLLHLDSLGHFIWAKSIGGVGKDLGMALALDRYNNIYLSGNFQYDMDFDPGASAFILSIPESNSSNINTNIFLLKLDASGVFKWAGSFESNYGVSYYTVARDIILDTWDNIYTTGAFGGTTDFDPDTAVFALTGSTIQDAFIHKFKQDCNSEVSIATTDSSTPSAEEYAICIGDSISLIALTSSDTDVLTYTWSTGESTQVITVSPDTSSIYHVSISYAPGCFKTDTVQIIVTDGLTEILYNGLDDDCNPATLDDDLDQDGFPLAEDCDDNNLMVNNGALEIPYNGLDDDCDPSTPDDDLDGDGYLMDDDCDDNNSFIPANPGSNCNDNNSNTFNDVIQSDSCTCVGEAFVDPPVFEWALKQGGEDGWNTAGTGVTTDRWGNVYNTGTFTSTVDFDPGPETLNITAAGNSDIFISKFTPTGKMLWTYTFGGEDYDEGHAITTDTFGNVYVSGGFKGTVDFDPSTEVHALTSTGDHDMFILKLDKAGKLVWVKNMSNYQHSGYRPVSDIKLDNFGNIYTTGFFQGEADFDPGPNEVIRTSLGYWIDIFILKLNNNGNFVWVRTFEGDGFDSGVALDIDNNNNIYTTGYFDNTIDFDPGPGTYYLSDSDIGSDGFVLKLNSAGNFIWAKKIAASSNCRSNGIAVSENGEVYITGYFFGTFMIGAGGGYGDVFIIKMNTNGNLSWGKILKPYVTSLSTDEARAKDIVLDENNNVYVLTTYDGFTDLDPGPGIYHNPDNNGDGVLVLKLSSEGNFVWAGILADDGILNWRGAIHVDEWENIYTTGIFGGTVDFDMSTDTFELTGGYKNSFVHKMRQQPCGALPGLCTSGSQFANCTEDSILLSVDLPPLASGLSYMWNTGETTDSIIVSPDLTTIYSLDVTYVSESALCSHSLSLEITVGGGNVEIPYNGLDDDCDETTPDDDLDQDGFGVSEDCDDNDATAYPGATEIPNNNTDEDCDGDILIIDEDMDGYNSDEDCDDSNPLINPGQLEIPFNSIDDDCNENTLDDNDDQDGDGFSNDIDCDDYNPLVNPGATEIPYNNIDDDCNELTPDDDLDQDGFLLSEDCNDLDASVPDAPGTPCNDFSNSTFNDVLLSDSCSCAGTTLVNESPELDWVFTEGGSASGYDILTDELGNVYVTGQFEGTIDFDPGPGVFNLSSLWWHDDIFVAKYTPDGQFLWARKFGDDYTDIGYGITLDGSGNVYMIGRYSDANGNVPTSFNIYIQKLSANGATLWTRKMGGDDWCQGHAISVDEEGNVYTTGRFAGTIDFNPSGGVYNLSSWANNSDNIFISKLDSQGNFVWAKNIGEGGTNIGNAIQVYNDHVYLTGTFRSDSDFDPSSGVYDLNRIGDSDLFVLKLNTNGEFIWAKQVGGVGAEIIGNDLVVDTNEDIYVTGYFEGEVDFPFGNDTLSLASESSHFVLKLNADGESIWLRPIVQGVSIGRGISLDDDNNVYTIGNYADTIDFDPGSATYYLTGNDSEYVTNVFIQKLNPEGEFKWAASFRGNSFSGGNALSVDGWGSVLSTGYFYDSLDFDPTPELYEVEAGTGGANLFIHKLIPQLCPTTPVVGSSDSVAYFCQSLGDTLILYAEMDTLNSPFYLEWSTGATSDSIVVAPDSTTMYTLLSYSYYGCGGVDSILVVVNINDTETPYNGIDDDCNELTLDDDLDGDGFGIAEDCDDNNALVNPDATEIPYNGLDDDCDELTLDDDLDQDGFVLAEDCDDDNPAINADAEEIPNNGIDEDCDGEDLIIIGTNDLLTIKLQIFPNPTKDILTLQFSQQVSATYKLRSTSGQLLQQGVFQKQVEVNVSGLATGVYILLLESEAGAWVERVVKL